MSYIGSVVAFCEMKFRMMKSRFIYLFLCLTLILNGCNDDSKGFGPYRSLVPGTYTGEIVLALHNSYSVSVEIVEKTDGVYELIMANSEYWEPPFFDILPNESISYYSLPDLEFTLDGLDERDYMAKIVISDGQPYTYGRYSPSLITVHDEYVSIGLWINTDQIGLEGLFVEKLL